MLRNHSGSEIIWQAGMPVPLADVKNADDSIEPLEVPALLKVNPDSDLSLLIKIVWGDKNNTVGIISAWECTQTNIMVKKIFTDTTTVDDADMKLYK